MNSHQLNKSKYKGEFKIPQFWIIDKSKSKNINRAVITIQSYYRGYLVRRLRIIQNCKAYQLRIIHAVKVIQRYWRRYVFYCNELNEMLLIQVPPKPYSPDHITNETKSKKEKYEKPEYNYKPHISNKSRKLAAKRRNQMGLGDLNVADALIQEKKILTSRNQK